MPILEKERFREALIERMNLTGVTAAELARRTGVSKPQIDKLRQRKSAVTNVYDAAGNVTSRLLNGTTPLGGSIQYVPGTDQVDRMDLPSTGAVLDPSWTGRELNSVNFNGKTVAFGWALPISPNYGEENLKYLTTSTVAGNTRTNDFSIYNDRSRYPLWVKASAYKAPVQLEMGGGGRQRYWEEGRDGRGEGWVWHWGSGLLARSSNWAAGDTTSTILATYGYTALGVANAAVGLFLNVTKQVTGLLGGEIRNQGTTYRTAQEVPSFEVPAGVPWPRVQNFPPLAQ